MDKHLCNKSKEARMKTVNKSEQASLTEIQSLCRSCCFDSSFEELNYDNLLNTFYYFNNSYAHQLDSNVPYSASLLSLPLSEHELNRIETQLNLMANSNGKSNEEQFENLHTLFFNKKAPVRNQTQVYSYPNAPFVFPYSQGSNVYAVQVITGQNTTQEETLFVDRCVNTDYVNYRKKKGQIELVDSDGRFPYQPSITSLPTQFQQLSFSVPQQMPQALFNLNFDPRLHTTPIPETKIENPWTKLAKELMQQDQEKNQRFKKVVRDIILKRRQEKLGRKDSELKLMPYNVQDSYSDMRFPYQSSVNSLPKHFENPVYKAPYRQSFQVYRGKTFHNNPFQQGTDHKLCACQTDDSFLLEQLDQLLLTQIQQMIMDDYRELTSKRSSRSREQTPLISRCKLIAENPAYSKKLSIRIQTDPSARITVKDFPSPKKGTSRDRDTCRLRKCPIEEQQRSRRSRPVYQEDQWRESYRNPYVDSNRFPDLCTFNKCPFDLCTKRQSPNRRDPTVGDEMFSLETPVLSAESNDITRSDLKFDEHLQAVQQQGRPAPVNETREDETATIKKNELSAAPRSDERGKSYNGEQNIDHINKNLNSTDTRNEDVASSTDKIAEKNIPPEIVRSYSSEEISEKQSKSPDPLPRTPERPQTANDSTSRNIIEDGGVVRRTSCTSDTCSLVRRKSCTSDTCSLKRNSADVAPGAKSRRTLYEKDVKRQEDEEKEMRSLLRTSETENQPQEPELALTRQEHRPPPEERRKSFEKSTRSRRDDEEKEMRSLLRTSETENQPQEPELAFTRQEHRPPPEERRKSFEKSTRSRRDDEEKEMRSLFRTSQTENQPPLPEARRTSFEKPTGSRKEKRNLDDVAPHPGENSRRTLYEKHLNKEEDEETEMRSVVRTSDAENQPRKPVPVSGRQAKLPVIEESPVRRIRDGDEEKEIRLTEKPSVKEPVPLPRARDKLRVVKDRNGTKPGDEEVQMTYTVRRSITEKNGNNLKRPSYEDHPRAVEMPKMNSKTKSDDKYSTNEKVKRPSTQTTQTSVQKIVSEEPSKKDLEPVTKPYTVKPIYIPSNISSNASDLIFSQVLDVDKDYHKKKLPKKDIGTDSKIKSWASESGSCRCDNSKYTNKYDRGAQTDDLFHFEPKPATYSSMKTQTLPVNISDPLDERKAKEDEDDSVELLDYGRFDEERGPKEEDSEKLMVKKDLEDKSSSPTVETDPEPCVKTNCDVLIDLIPSTQKDSINSEYCSAESLSEWPPSAKKHVKEKTDASPPVKKYVDPSRDQEDSLRSKDKYKSKPKNTEFEDVTEYSTQDYSKPPVRKEYEPTSEPKDTNDLYPTQTRVDTKPILRHEYETTDDSYRPKKRSKPEFIDSDPSDPTRSPDYTKAEGRKGQIYESTEDLDTPDKRDRSTAKDADSTRDRDYAKPMARDGYHSTADSDIPEDRYRSDNSDPTRSRRYTKPMVRQGYESTEDSDQPDKRPAKDTDPTRARGYQKPITRDGYDSTNKSDRPNDRYGSPPKDADSTRGRDYTKLVGRDGFDSTNDPDRSNDRYRSPTNDADPTRARGYTKPITRDGYDSTNKSDRPNDRYGPASKDADSTRGRDYNKPMGRDGYDSTNDSDRSNDRYGSPINDADPSRSRRYTKPITRDGYDSTNKSDRPNDRYGPASKDADSTRGRDYNKPMGRDGYDSTNDSDRSNDRYGSPINDADPSRSRRYTKPITRDGYDSTNKSDRPNDRYGPASKDADSTRGRDYNKPMGRDGYDSTNDSDRSNDRYGSPINDADPSRSRRYTKPMAREGYDSANDPDRSNDRYMSPTNDTGPTRSRRYTPPMSDYVHDSANDSDRANDRYSAPTKDTVPTRFRRYTPPKSDYVHESTNDSDPTNKRYRSPSNDLDNSHSTRGRDYNKSTARKEHDSTDDSDRPKDQYGFKSTDSDITISRDDTALPVGKRTDYSDDDRYKSEQLEPVSEYSSPTRGRAASPPMDTNASEYSTRSKPGYISPPKEKLEPVTQYTGPARDRKDAPRPIVTEGLGSVKQNWDQPNDRYISQPKETETPGTLKDKEVSRPKEIQGVEQVNMKEKRQQGKPVKSDVTRQNEIKFEKDTPMVADFDKRHSHNPSIGDLVPMGSLLLNKIKDMIASHFETWTTTEAGPLNIVVEEDTEADAEVFHKAIQADVGEVDVEITAKTKMHKQVAVNVNTTFTPKDKLKNKNTEGPDKFRIRSGGGSPQTQDDAARIAKSEESEHVPEKIRIRSREGSPVRDVAVLAVSPPETENEADSITISAESNEEREQVPEKDWKMKRAGSPIRDVAVSTVTPPEMPTQKKRKSVHAYQVTEADMVPKKRGRSLKDKLDENVDFDNDDRKRLHKIHSKLKTALRTVSDALEEVETVEDICKC